MFTSFPLEAYNDQIDPWRILQLFYIVKSVSFITNNSFINVISIVLFLRSTYELYSYFSDSAPLITQIELILFLVYYCVK